MIVNDIENATGVKILSKLRNGVYYGIYKEVRCVIFVDVFNKSVVFVIKDLKGKLLERIAL